jgi:hypothetical protein
MLILLAATATRAQTTLWLQNDDYTGGALTCITGLTDNQSMAAKFTAPPDQYPYSIQRIRVMCCGLSVGACAFTIWQDDGTTANPGPVLYQSADVFQIGGSPTPAFYDIVMPTNVPMITSGTIRVALYVLLVAPGFGVDVDGITAQRNLFHSGVSWLYAEDPPVNLQGDWIMRLEVVGPPTAIGDEPAPRSFALHPNVPNPFNPQTTIQYDVPGSGADVNITVYDVAGRMVVELVDRHRAAGRWSVQWNGEDERGQRVASGLYFYRMRAGSFVETRKMVLLK